MQERLKNAIAGAALLGMAAPLSRLIWYVILSFFFDLSWVQPWHFAALVVAGGLAGAGVGLVPIEDDSPHYTDTQWPAGAL